MNWMVPVTILKLNFLSFLCHSGPNPNKPQDCFMYRRQEGVLSAMLDDDNCDAYTTLSMGHGMCGPDFLDSCGPRGRFGVDLLYDTYCQTPDFKHKLALYFKGQGHSLYT